jgi:uncharacterized protein (DUF1800 family)
MLTQQTAIATNRFGTGARAGDATRIGDDPAGWLEAQIARGPERAAPGTGPTSAQVLAEVGQLRLARQAAQSRASGEPAQVDREAVREFGQYIAQSYQTQANALYANAITSDAPFRERLALFWGNHFAVSAEKQPIGAIAGLYVDEAIRPNLTGNFREMLRAAIQHPAMLLYLDNQTSIGPGSLLGSRANRGDRRAGLNENLAREIMELHTLGVDGGYTQDDVIEFSKVLTGWSVGQAEGEAARLGALAGRLGGAREAGEPGEFTFRGVVHEPGSKTILGQRFGEGGVDEGEAVLDFLARRPETARFLATKLARHFVADAPPPALVETLAKTYLDGDGELAPVYRELIRANESWREGLAKYKTPQDYLISVFRALGQPPPANQTVALATQLGQRPMTPGSPAGWPDIADNWTSGDALLKRIEWSTTLGATVGDRIDAVARLDEVLGEIAGEATRNGVRRAESGAQAIALLFAAPEFQRR